MLLRLAHDISSKGQKRRQETQKAIEGNPFCAKTWDLSRSFAGEHVPQEVLKYLQVTKLAERQDCAHLPSFSAMFREGMMLQIEFKNEAQKLSQFIADRVFMESYGSIIFMSLIAALAELSEVGIVHRNLSPDSIYVSNDFSKLKFSDFQNSLMTSWNDGARAFGIFPYSALQDKVAKQEGAESPGQDLWSVGVVLLEIVVGSNFVQNARRVEDIESIMSLVEEYVPKEVYDLLDDLLFHHDCYAFSSK